MRVAVTGAAGFIGSHLAEALIAAGHEVVGLDNLTPYYDVEQKCANVRPLLGSPAFELLEADLQSADLAPLLDGVQIVFHQAGQPGVRMSWAKDFDRYVDRNLLVTQRLLEWAREARLARLVYASSSSIYGNAERFPTHETDVPAPYSPYGVTKLAAEHLCGLYAANWGVPTVSLRYFTVYGPRQRPDMAFHRAIEATLCREPFELYGDGTQIRDFTYVADIVAANLAAADAPVEPGSVFNIAGGGSHSMNEALQLISDLAGIELDVRRGDRSDGDVLRTGGAIDRARTAFGWEPKVSLRDGLASQIEWHRRLREPQRDGA